jgi:glucosamine--fructose-6-phosphate aminotransferase (isomerizing)
MYDEITAQPEAVRRSLERAQEHGTDAVRLIGRARRVFLAGSGTSLHAAEIGAWFLRMFSRGRIEAWALQSYELVTYLPGLRPDDLVLAVSHSGTSTMTTRVLERARRTGAESVLVTGFLESPAARIARQVVPTGFDEERSWAHTASYTAALTTLAALANDLAVPEERLDLSPLPDVVAETLGLEEMAHRLAAAALAGLQGMGARIVLVGGGANAVTAREAQLKILETSYLPAATFELEQVLHGPLAAVPPGSLALVVAPPGASTERAADLVRALGRLQAEPVVLCGGDNAEAFPGAHRFVMPDVPEVISPIHSIVPLQLFAYFLAVGRGTNPDLIHRDDERQREARAQFS